MHCKCTLLLMLLSLTAVTMCTAAETGYSFDKIKLLELEGARNQGSPGRSLLWELGSRNTTVRQLYGYLSILGRYREMKILEDYGECWKTLSGCGVVFCCFVLNIFSFVMYLGVMGGGGGGQCTM